MCTIEQKEEKCTCWIVAEFFFFLLETTVAFWEEKGVRKWFLSVFSMHVVCGYFRALASVKRRKERKRSREECQLFHFTTGAG